MYVFRVTYSPATAKYGEALTALKERVKDLQKTPGVRIFMMNKMLIPEGGFQVQLVSLFNSLNDWGDGWSSRLQAIAPDAAQTQWAQKIDPLLRAPIASELWEVLVPIKIPPKVGEYVVRQSMYPDSSHGMEFRNSVTELTKQLQAQGWNAGAYAQFMPHAGPVFQFIVPLARLGDWEAMLAKRTPEVFTWLRTYTALMRKPIDFELWGMATPPPQM